MKDLVTWKSCRTCKQNKPLTEFYIKVARKRLADGTMKVYDPKPVPDCDDCAREIYKKYEKKSKAYDQKRKEQVLMESLTPALHPYL